MLSGPLQKKMGPKGEAEQPNSGEGQDQGGSGGLGGNNWGSVLRTAHEGETAPAKSLCFKFKFTFLGESLIG